MHSFAKRNSLPTALQPLEKHELGTVQDREKKIYPQGYSSL